MPHMNNRLETQRGASTAVIITIVLLSIFLIAFAALSVWAYINYDDQKTNVDAKVDKAVAIAEKEQADQLEAKFLEREKEPNKIFASPSDYGTLRFKYPKTWSVFVENNGQEGEGFTAYLNPGVVPPVTETTRFALRVSITNDKFEDVIAEYQSVVEEGELKSTAIRANGIDGARLDGKFSEDIRGTAVVYKIRDKTAVVRSDADTFKADFEALIQTINFNK